MQIIRGKIESAQKVIVYGPEGIGKSYFASKFPNPVFIDTEGSTKYLDVARTERPTSWTMLLQQVQYFKNNPTACDTLIIDTADWAERLCAEEICAKAQKKGIEDFGYGKGYVYLAEEFGRLLNALTELIDLGINVVMVAHAQMRKFEQPDELGAYDRWELKLQKKTAPLVKEWADMVLFANYKTLVVNVDGQGATKGKNKARGGERVMYTSHHPCWDAKTRFHLPPELPLDYNEISNIIYTRPTPPTPPRPKPESQSPRPEPQPRPQSAPEPELPELVDSSDSAAVEQELDAIQNNDGVPRRSLADLMQANNVTVQEIQQAVASRGYYPMDTPIENYDPGFIDGVLVGAWGQMLQVILENRGGLKT